MDRTAAFYSGPSYVGGSFPVFSGSRRHRGGSIFGALKSFFMPILSGFGKKLAKRGAKQALGLVKDVAHDAFNNKNVIESLKTHGKKHALDIGTYAADAGIHEIQKMLGSGRRPPKRRRQSLRKRKAGTKRTKSQPRKKRRTSAKPLF